MLKIGHRGAKGYKPENTLSSFKHAIKLGADMIELDIQLTKDNIPIVIHDPTINRTTNGKGKIKKYTLKELKKFNIKYKGKITKEKIPTLEEILKLKTKFNIEIKNKNAAEKVAEIITQLKLENKTIISSSFSKPLKEIKSLYPKIKTAWICYSEHSKLKTGIIITLLKSLPNKIIINKVKKIKADYLHPHIKLCTKKFISDMAKANLKINVWTVNNKRTIKKLKKLNINGIMSDYPDKL